MFPDIPPPLEVPAEQRRRILFNAFRDFLERSARVTPVVAVFEDLHWADGPTSRRFFCCSTLHTARLECGSSLLALTATRT
jgi:hypothetical protein